MLLDRKQSSIIFHLFHELVSIHSARIKEEAKILGGLALVFFLSKKEVEIEDILKKDPAAKKAYKEILNGLEHALMLYIYDSGPYPPDEGVQILPFADLAHWAEQD